eukprot:COSAG01_NODE_6610_length_3578_cov_2.591549_3_plen_56_part_00
MTNLLLRAERAVTSGAGQFEVFGMKQTRESFADELRKRTSGVGSAQVRVAVVWPL